MGKTFSFVSGALFGAAAGAIVGVALAPRSGAETRAMAADIANDAWDNMRDTYEHSAEEARAAVNDFGPMVDAKTDDLRAKVEAGEGVAPKGTKRILYTGTPMTVPNWKLFNLIEKAGGVVVGEESCTGSRYYKDLVDETGETVDEMLDAIAERYFKINCAVFTPNDQRMKDIVQVAKDLHADGIVDVALQFCTLYEMESFAVEKAAEEAGIPFMHITTDYAGEDAGQLQTRIEAFLETI